MNIESVMNVVNTFVDDLYDDDQYTKAKTRFMKDEKQKRLREAFEKILNQTGTPKTETKRKPRDPKAPRASSARQCFFDKMKEQGIDGVVKKWNEMTPEQKAPYEEMSQRSKAETAIKRESYTPTNGESKKPKTRTPKAKSAKEFYLASDENKKRMKASLQERKLEHMAKHIKEALSSEWNELVTEKSSKIRKWEKMAEEEKVRFDREQQKIKELIEEQRNRSESKSPTTKTETSARSPIKRPTAPSPSTQPKTEKKATKKEESSDEEENFEGFEVDFESS